MRTRFRLTLKNDTVELFDGVVWAEEQAHSQMHGSTDIVLVYDLNENPAVREVLTSWKGEVVASWLPI